MDRCKNEVKLSVNHWLQAQEPRVMTLEDVLKLRFNDVVYFEMAISSVAIPAIVIDVIEHMPDGEIGLLQLRHIQQPTNNADLEYYGKTWRCWTSRPTDEQREATPWQAPSTSDSAPNG